VKPFKGVCQKSSRMLSKKARGIEGTSKRREKNQKRGTVIRKKRKKKLRPKGRHQNLKG